MMKNYLSKLLAIFLVMAAGPALAQITETISSSGTWTAPAGVTSVVVECWGGGGGGASGGGSTNGANTAGGGGAGGAYARDTITVIPGANYTVMVGAGGAGGSTVDASIRDGGVGGSSWFGTDTTVLATGGAGGSAPANTSSSGGGTGGAGSSAGSIGTTIFAGGSGSAGTNNSFSSFFLRGGSGGGSAGSMGAGGNATSSAGGAAGAGGGAAGANGKTGSSGNGAIANNGSVPGSGGAGGRSTSTLTNSAGSGGAGRVLVTYTPPPPDNNEAMGAVALTVNSDNNCTATTMGTTVGATESADPAPECFASATEDDVWYSFVATNTAHRITFSNNSTAMAAALYTGTPGALVPVASACAGDNALTVSGLTANATYYIRAYTAADNTNTLTSFDICVGVPAAAPANDDCGTAITVSSFPYSDSLAMPGSATQSSFQTTCSTAAMNDGVWFDITGTQGGKFKITVTPTGWDAAIGVYSGSCGALSCVTTDNDESGAGVETYTLSTTAGTVYYINIGYASGTANNEEKAFKLLIEDVSPPANDDAAGAFLLTPGTGCPSELFTNQYATKSQYEQGPTCRNIFAQNIRPVWFKFVAPLSGAVRISTDNGGSLTSTRSALFSATDSADYSTFSSIQCAGNSGVTSAFNNIFYPVGLNPGETYYIAVDAYYVNDQGTFCVTVDELDSTMIATGTGDCIAGKTMSGFMENSSTPYRGWISLVDGQGKLNANIRQVSGSENGISHTRTIKSGNLRMDADGTTYMNRNFSIVGPDVTNADVRLFFTNSELAAMGVATGQLNVTRQTGNTCRADFTDTINATASLLAQTANGSANGVNWIQVNTPGFSNFYIHTGNTPLPLELISFTGRYRNGINLLNWETAAEYNLSHFELQRSADGKQFTTIGNIEAKGDKSNRYQFSDNNTLAGRNIYRLKMSDKDGSFEYSDAIEVNNSAGSGITMRAVPNPVKDLLHVSLSGIANSQAGYLQVIDIYGKTVYQEQPDSNNITIDMSALSSGNYYIRYTDATGTRTIKIVKK